MMKILKKVTAVFIAVTLLMTPFSAFAQEAEPESVKILFIGNSLISYNEMVSKVFPSLCAVGGKNVEVTSVTENGSTLYRFANESTPEGQRVAAALSEKTYDYVIFSPSRRVTPFEYSVYHAERQAALRLNSVISATGAKTLLIASAGLNTGMIPVYKMGDNGISSTTDYELPMDRNTHSMYFENLCLDLCSQMTNASVVRVGAATEVLLKHFPDYNSLYRSDNRHPSARGSYLQAACVYSAIFGESPIGLEYTDSLYGSNAIIAQRAAAVAQLGEAEEVLDTEKCERVLNATLTSNFSAKLDWVEPLYAEYYEVFRKAGKGSYELIGRTEANECEYYDEGLLSDEIYYYKIRAIHKVGRLEFYSNYSSSMSVQTLAVPQQPSVTLVNKKTADITFANVENATSYSIYRRKDGSEIKDYIATVTDAFYTDTTLKAGNTYFYSIVAHKEDGVVTSEISKEKKIVSLASPKSTLVSLAKGRVKITVNPVKNADGYVVYYKKSTSAKYKRLATTPKLVVKAVGLKSNTVYNFKIKAFKGKNYANTSSIYRNYKIKVK